MLYTSMMHKGNLPRPSFAAGAPQRPAHRLATALKPEAKPMASTSAQLTLYDDDHSLYCSKVRIALLRKNVPFQSAAVPCGSTQSAEFKQISPLAKIPALVVRMPKDEDQAPVSIPLLESEVIAEYLEEAFPPPAHPPLLPTHPLLRAQARAISRFHDLYFEPTLRRLYPQVAPARRDLAQVKAAVQELQVRLEQLEILLQ